MSREFDLVTGGAGFIGSHLAEGLLEKGRKVIILDNFSSGKKENIQHLGEGFGASLELVEGEYSPWLQLEFKAGFRKRVSGIARFLVTEMEPNLNIYMTPINIDPEKPALPVSHPLFFFISIKGLHDK